MLCTFVGGAAIPCCDVTCDLLRARTPLALLLLGLGLRWAAGGLRWRTDWNARRLGRRTARLLLFLLLAPAASITSP